MKNRGALTLNDAVKCQACVSCRTRKLRCTKESEACIRCIGEGVDCVFPPRKTMGRPKSYGQVNKASTPQGPPMLQAGPALHIMRLRESPSQTTLNSGPDGVQAPTKCQNDQQRSWTEFGIGIVDSRKNINFGGQDSDSLWHSLPPMPFFKTRNPHDPRSKNETHHSAAPCFCTHRLFGCLDSLSTMTNNFWSALWTARHASRTIYEALKCAQCMTTSGRDSEPSPTIVILATVVFPSLSDSYRKVAELVKNETETAMDSGTQLLFDLGTCGGLWGPLSESSMACQEYYSNLLMDAESWGTTVRALLRADIHGFDVQKRNDEDGTYMYHQPGLCDFLSDIKDVLDKGSPGKLQSDTVLVSQMIEVAQRSLNQLALA